MAGDRDNTSYYMSIGDSPINMCWLGNRIIKQISTKESHIIREGFLSFPNASPELFDSDCMALKGVAITGDVTFGATNEDSFIEITDNGTHKQIGYKVNSPLFITSFTILGDSYFDSMTGLFFKVKFCGQTFVLRVQVGEYHLIFPDGSEVQYSAGQDIYFNLIYNEETSQYSVRVTYNYIDYEFIATELNASDDQFSISDNSSGNNGKSVLFFECKGIVNKKET